MSNLVKKISSAIAGVAVVMTTVSPIAGVSANYDGMDAANKLASSGIIVDQSANPSDYRLGDAITRREQAKITINLAGLEVSDTCEGKFKDLPSSDWGCKYAEAGLKAGFFAANENFRPNDKVSKGEALKMVMKAKGLASTDGVSPWQAAYVDAAVKAGISEEFSDYNTSAIRSDIFTWSANIIDSTNTDTTDNGDLGDILGDLDLGTDTTNTGSTTTDTGSIIVNTGAVLTGDLTVSLNPNSPANGTQIPKAGIVKFGTVDFSAASSDISLTSVELVKAGLASVPTSTKVWFEKNGVRISGKTSFTSENNAIISFAPAYVVKAGTTESVDLFVELSSTTSGDGYQFMSRTIESSASKVTGGFTTSVLVTANYNVATATIDQNGVGTTQNASTDSIELAKFKISNTDANSDTRDIAFKSILLYQQGTANLTNLSNIVIERNGIVVSSGVTLDGKKLTVAVNDIIKDGSTALYTLRAVITNVELTTDTYNFYVKNTSDVTLDETISSFRSVVTGTPTFGTYSITGGDVKFERDSTVALSSTVAPGTSDVVLMKGMITAKSAVNLENITLGYTINGVANVGATTQMNTVYLKIGGSTFTWTPADGAASFLGTATVSGTVPVLIYTKLKDGATANIKFDDLKLSSFTTKEYVVNQNQVTTSIGSISGVQVTIGASTLNLTRTDGLGNPTLSSGSKGITVYSARFSSTQGNTISLSNIGATLAGSSAFAGNTDLDLYVDGVLKSSKTILAATTSVTFNNFNADVTTSKAVDITIKANFQDAVNAGTFQVASISYDAVDNVTSIAVTKPTVAGATFTIGNAQGTLAATSGDILVNKSLLLSSTDSGSLGQKIVSFKIGATNDTIKLKDLAITGTNMDKLSNIRLVDSSMNLIGYASNVTATTATFANLNSSTNISNTIAVDQTATYYIIADVNSATDATGVSINVVTAGSDIQGSNGTVIALLGTNVTGASHDIAQNTFKVTQVTPTTKSIASSAMEFRVDSFGKNSVTLNTATITASLGSFTGYTSGVAKIYTKNGDFVGSVVPTMALTEATAVIPMSFFNTIDKNTSTTYQVRFEGLTLNPSTNEAFTVRLTELTTTANPNVLSATSYARNTETLPLISTK